MNLLIGTEKNGKEIYHNLKKLSIPRSFELQSGK